MNTSESIITLTKELCSIPSYYPNHTEKKAVLQHAIDWLAAKGVNGTYYDHEESPSFVAKIEGSGKPILVLAHIDVVPAPEHMFNIKEEGEKLFGRGVQDDKGPAAILMHVLAHAKTMDNPPNIELVLTTDEERGSEDGVQRLVELGIFTEPRFVLALDGGAQNTVVTAEKGVAHIMLEATGAAVHNSQPWSGDNAVDKLIRCYHRLKEALETGFEAPEYWHNTVSIGRIEGGQFVNQAPATAVAEIDIRFVGPHTVAGVTEIINNALEPGVVLARNSAGEAFTSDQSDPLIQSYKAAMEDVTSSTVELVSEHGATDGRFFKEYNCPIILHYPDGGEIHTDNEWVDTASMLRIYNGIVKFLENVV